jgi:hypothetical protein
MHLFIISAVKLPLDRPASSPLFRDATNSDFAIATSAVGPRVGVVQAKLLFFVVSALVGFVAYTSIPGLVRIQCAEAAPVSSPVGAEGGGFVCTAGCALVAESVDLVGEPALDSGRSRRRSVVSGGVVAATVEGVEAGWWESQATGAIVGEAGLWVSL